MMKTLLIMRHAKSSWKNNNLADYDRPLNKRGKRDAPRMGKLLKQEGNVPELIISSSAERALSTAEAVALASDYETEIQTTRQLYHALSEDYIEVLKSVPNKVQRVMVVGHNPGMEGLVEELTDEWIRMPTAALVQISLEIDQWSELSLESKHELINYWWPKDLP